MQNIVVPTDFSIMSFNALELAKSIAKKTDGTIYLIHVMEHIVRRYPGLENVVEDNFDDEPNTQLTEKS